MGQQIGLFINTAGIGWIRPGINLSSINAKPGDKILLSGYLGDHEMTILSQREGFKFQGELRSDCAPLNDLVGKMLDALPFHPMYARPHPWWFGHYPQ